MADYRKYMIRPLQHGVDLSIPGLHQPFENATWGAQNFTIEQRSMKKRRGYIEHRDLGRNVNVQQIIWMIYSGGTAATIVLTDTDAIKIETDTGKTWSYINEEHTAEINPALCHGCGICVAECPAKTITLRHYTHGQIMAKIEALPEEEDDLQDQQVAAGN